jgi:cobalamin biosynthetic protein CobC
MTDRWTWHGGGLQAARAHYGDADAPWLDLSTGINPHGWPMPELPIDWTRLPEEADLKALERAAAAHFGADPDHVCALPGTEIGLRLMGDLIPGPACHLRPSYRTHGDMLPGSTPVDDPMQAKSATLILANPNNPDGRLYDPARLLPLIDQRGDGWFIVDEAFADTHP